MFVVYFFLLRMAIAYRQSNKQTSLLSNINLCLFCSPFPSSYSSLLSSPTLPSSPVLPLSFPTFYPPLFLFLILPFPFLSLYLFLSLSLLSIFMFVFLFLISSYTFQAFDYLPDLVVKHLHAVRGPRVAVKIRVVAVFVESKAAAMPVVAIR